jgi:hypothetical protein
MALTSVVSSSGTASKDKQIAERLAGAATVVLYTVPLGRKFKGMLTTSRETDTSSTTIAYIDSKHVVYMPKSGPIYLELAAGAIVTCGSATYPTGIFGVESDA